MTTNSKKSSINKYSQEWYSLASVEKISQLRDTYDTIVNSILYKYLFKDEKPTSENISELKKSYMDMFTTAYTKVDKYSQQDSDPKDKASSAYQSNAYLGSFTYSEAKGVRRYYHIVVKDAMENILGKGNKFSLEFIRNKGLVDKIKGLALDEYCKSLPNDAGDRLKKDSKLVSSILGKTIITSYHLTTGKKSAGNPIYFQVILGITKPNKKEIKKIITESEAAVPEVSYETKTFTLHQHIGAAKHPKSANGDDYLDHFKSALKLLNIVDGKNTKLPLSEQYIVSFAALEKETQKYYDYIAGKKLEVSKMSDDVFKNTVINYAFTTFDQNTGKNTKIYSLSQQGTSVVSKMPPAPPVEGPPAPESMQAKMTEEVSNLEAPSAKHVNSEYSENFINLLYYIDVIASDYKNFGEKIEVSYFVENYLVTYAKLPSNSFETSGLASDEFSSALFKKVYNTGEVEYKKSEDIERERNMPKELKEKIFSQVNNSFIQTSDAAFLNILSNSKSIKTIEDIYDRIVNAIPISEIVSTALSCVKKHIDDPIDKTCDIIISNLRIDEVDKILKYAGTSSAIEARKLNFVIKSRMAGATDNKTARGVLQQIYRSGVDSEKRLLCLAIFAAIPAAIMMRSQIEDAFEELTDSIPTRGEVENLIDKGKDFVEKKIETSKDRIIAANKNLLDDLVNPFESVGRAIEEQLEAYKGVDITRDFSEALTGALIAFVEEFIVQTITSVLDQITKLCEGTSNADFANLSGKQPNSNFPAGVVPTFPFVPDFLNNIITDDNAANELSNFVDPTDDNFGMLINDLLTDLSDLLTISEICALFSKDTSEFALNIILDKIWSGLLSISKYQPLKTKLKTKGNLFQWLYLLQPYIDKQACIDAINDLENTKKLINEVCDPVSNGAIVGDLLEKASADAVAQLLNQEEDNLGGLLNNIKNLVDLAIDQDGNLAPELFCGPEAKASGKEPLFEKSAHPSLEFLIQKEMDRTFKIVVDSFESDLSKFGPILMYDIDPGNLSDVGQKLTNMFTAGNNVAGAMAGIYGIENAEVSGNVPTKNKGELEKASENNSLVAKKVSKYLLNNSYIEVKKPTNEDEVVSLTATGVGDKVTVSYNFSENFYQNPQNQKDIIPPRTVRMQVDDYYEYTSPIEYFLSLKPNQDYKNMFATTFLDGSSGNAYDDFIKERITDSDSLSFFADITAQIIQEHAEVISKQNLFQRSVFEKLKLSRKNPCAASLLYTKDLFDEIIPRSDRIQCKYGMGIVPNAPEMSRIISYIHLYLRVTVLNEIFKGFFVFGAYGFNALMAQSNNQKPEFDSFYLKYLKDQIKRQLYFTSNSSNSDKSQPYGLRYGFSESIDFMRYLKIGYIADNDLEQSIESITSDQVLNPIVNSTITYAKLRINSILKEAGIVGFDGQDSNVFENFDLLDEVEGLDAADFEDSKELDDFYLDAYSDYVFNSEFVRSQLLKNLLTTNAYGTLNSSIEDNYQTEAAQSYNPIIQPPNAADCVVDAENYILEVPTGYYTAKNKSRLANGGFFLEQGYEVSHIYKDEIKNFPGIKPFSIDDYNFILDKLPSDPFEEFPLLLTLKIPLLAGETLGEGALSILSLVGLDVEEILLRNEYNKESFEQKTAGGYFDILFGTNEEKEFACSRYVNIPTKNNLKLEGRISASDFKNNYSISDIQDRFSVFDGFCNAIIKLADLSQDEKTRIKALGTQNLFFKKFNAYTTLNVLIPITDGSTETASDRLYFETLGNLTFGEIVKNLGFGTQSFLIAGGVLQGQTDEELDQKHSKSFKKGFANSILNRKYFIRERASDNQEAKLFLKLPLVYMLHSKKTETFEITSEDSTKIYEAYGKPYPTLITDVYISSVEGDPEGVQVSSEDVAPKGPFPSDIYDVLANTNSFKSLADNIQYESILSFISVFITETTQGQYKSLNSMFMKTYTVIKAGLSGLVNAAERQNDPEGFYKKENFFDQLGANIPQVDMDLIPMLIEMFIKMLANMSDPTWKTPWFFPGPLTPFGIVAKILDNSGESEGDDAATKKQNEMKDNVSNSMDCDSPIDT